MDSYGPRSLRRISFLVIGGGALLALAISSFSHDPAFLLFGLGPAFVGLMFFFTSFFTVKEAKNPLPRWRGLAFWLLTAGLYVPHLFFNYRLPEKLRLFVLIAYLIISMLLVLWPAKPHPEQGSENPIAGGGVISN